MQLAQGFVISDNSEITLEELMANYGEKLLRYATSILCSYQDAEDVVQDVFIYAYQNRTKFHGGNISAWLYKITYNDCLDKVKSRQRRKWFFFNDVDVKEEPAIYMEDTITMPEIMKILEKLKPQERALLFGRIMSGQSYEELSKIMDSTPATLRKQYERVKKKAAKYLNEYGYGTTIESFQAPIAFNNEPCRKYIKTCKHVEMKGADYNDA